MGQTAQLHAVVIAGGSGTRFWPLSRQAHPKQLLNLSGEDNLLHATFARIRPLAPEERWWMVVGAHHAAGCRAAAPEVRQSQGLVEPQARNTAPAIALAALHLAHAHPDATMVVLPADHHVADPKAFCAAVQLAAKVAAAGRIVTLGITPTHPETGFGYIQQGDASAGDEAGAYGVARFCEKPDAATARGFLAAKTYLWNAGIFVMRARTYLDEVARQLPELSAQLAPVAQAIGTPGYDLALEAAYHAIKGISIDYGVMEKARDAAVVPVQCGWSDVGSFNALGAVVAADDAGNVVRGEAVLLEVNNSVVVASEGSVVAGVGLNDLVVVHTADATLVMPKDRAQDVRQVMQALQERGWRQYL